MMHYLLFGTRQKCLKVKGEYATIARKSEEDWFIGSLVANGARKLEIPLSFLDVRMTYEALIFSQDADGLKNNSVSLETIMVNQKSILSSELMQNSGLAVIIRKK